METRTGNRSILGTRPMRIQDMASIEALVRPSGEFRIVAGMEDLAAPAASLGSWIRSRMESEKSGDSWTTLLVDETDGTLRGLAGLTRIDRSRSCAEMLLCLPLEDGSRNGLLDGVLKTAFYRFDLHRIEIRIRDDSRSTDWLRANGWSPEGILRGAVL